MQKSKYFLMNAAAGYGARVFLWSCNSESTETDFKIAAAHRHLEVISVWRCHDKNYNTREGTFWGYEIHHESWEPIKAYMLEKFGEPLKRIPD